MRFFAKSFTTACLLAGFAMLKALPVYAVEPPGFAKTFSPARVARGGISRLTYTIDNSANAVAVGGLAFSEFFPLGLSVISIFNRDSCGGTLELGGYNDELNFTGGSVAAGQICTFSANVQGQVVGALESQSGALTSDLPADTPGARATLTVVRSLPLSVSMAFSPPVIRAGGVSRLSYDLRNVTVFEQATSVSLSDTLPPGVVVADPPDAQTTCTGGTLTAAAGSDTITFTGGVFDANAACTIAVDMTSTVPGSYRNETESVTSSLGASTPAEATLTVDPAEAPGFARVFAPDSVRQGGETQIVFTVDNTANLIDLGELAFTDAFPDGLVVADAPNAENSCGGTFSPVAGATTLAFADGVLAAGATCELRVAVRAIGAGALTGPAVTLTSNVAPATAAEARLDVTPPEASGFAKAFSPATVFPGGVSKLTFTIDNAANLIDVGGLAFDDDFPDGLAVAATPNGSTTCGGAFAPAASATSLAFSGGRVGAGQSCTLSVDVRALRAGALTGTSGELTSDLPVTTPGASATLTVSEAALTVVLSFSPSTIGQGGVSTLTYRLRNLAPVAATSVALSDMLPDGVVLADPPNAETTCAGGTLTAAAGGSEVSYSDGTLSRGNACTITVEVTSVAVGSHPNDTVSATSSLGTTGRPTPATLTVDPAAAPGFAKAFSPATVDPGGVSTLTFRIDNTANLIDVGGLAFEDDFPDGLAVAATPNGSTTCGGTFAPAVSATSLAFSGGRVAAGQTCTISVDVLASRAGALTDMSGELTSDLPVATPGTSATLTVSEAPLSVSMSFAPAAIGQGRVSRLTYGLDNAAVVEATSVALSDTLPADVVLAGVPNAETTCVGGTLTAAAGGGDVSYSGGTLGAGATCTIAVDVTSTAAGSHRNSTETVTSSLGASPPAEATLTVDPAAAPGFARVFSPDTIPQGGETQILFTVDNGANAIAMTGMAFDDSLPSGVSVADTPGAVNGCGGTFGPVAGATTLGFADGVLAAGATCEIRVTVRAIEAGTLTGTAVSLTSSIATATAAEATLTVDPAAAPGFAKSFSPATVDPGGISTLTFRIDNAANAIDVGSLAFTDAFPDGLAVAGTPNGSTTCGGTFAPATSATSLAFTGGRVAAGQTCTISVDVVASRAGALTGTSGNLTSDLPVTTPGASATLTVNEEPLSVSMSFAPSMIDQGRVSRLTYGLDNGAAVAATSVSLSDTLPADVVLADPPDAQTTCAGGTLTAAAGGSEVSYSGGTLGAGATCMIAVDVTSTTAGSHRNSTETVTSSLGDSTPAEATLTVDAADAPGFAKVFSPATVDPGGISTLTFRIDNTANAIDVGGLAFDDDFPDGLAVAGTPNGSTTCGGTFAPAASATSLAFSGGRVGAGQTCTISVDVLALRSGALTSTSGDLTSDLPVATSGASATLTVNEVPLSVSIAFEPATIDQGRVSRLTYDLNNGAAVEATSVDLSDTLPADVVLADPPDARTTCTGGTLTAGGGDVSYSGGSLGAGAACAITVDVISVAVGSHSNDMASVTSSLGASPPAEATLTVDAAEAPGFSKAFSPARVALDGTSRLTYTIDNSANAVAVGGLAFFESFRGLEVFNVSNAENSCGGTLELGGNNDELSFTGGSVAAGQTCTLAVDVQGRRVGELASRSGALTSDLPADTPGARATLTVVRSLPLSVSMAFSPPVIRAGGVSRLSYDLRNVTVFEQATSVSLSDTLPPGVVVADPPDAQTTCTGGTLTAAAGSDTITFTGGVFDANAACTISIDMTSTVPGSYRNETESVTSSLGASTPAEATLTVDPAEAPGFARVFAPDSVRQGGETQIVFTVDNTANLIDLGELAFTDAFPDGLVVADAPNAENSCGGTFSPVAGATTLAFADGVLAAGATCELRVAVRAIGAGALTGPAVTLTSNVAPATAAEARLDVTPPEAPGFAKAFSPATVFPGGVSKLTFTIDNAANLIDVGGLAFDDDFPAGLAVADPPNGSTTCGGTFAPAASATSLAFSGGRVGAGQSCTLSVDVRALRAGALTGMSGELTSDLPVTTPGASATLTVSEAALTVVLSFSPSTIGQGGVSMLTYRLRNLAPVPAASVALSDTLPAGVVLADPPNAETTCAGGTLTAAAGGSEVSYSDGTLSRGNACTITVEVTSVAVGSHPNDTVSATSSLGTTGRPTPATLTVDPAAAPGFARVFLPDTIGQGGETQIVFTVDNTANAIAMTEMAFADSLPPGVSVADTPGTANSCGGAFSPVAGATTLSFADGVLAAGATCELRVTVRATGAGTLTGPAVALTSSIATASAAEATLTVEPAEAPGFAKAFSPATVDPGGISTLTFRIDNTANLIDVGGLAFDDDFPDGLAVAATPNGSTTCGGTFAPAVSATSLAFTGGRVAAGQTCTISVDVLASRAGTLTGTSGDLTSDLPVATSGASATLTVNEEPLSVSMSFVPSMIGQGRVSRLTYGLDNGAAVAAASVSLSDTLPAGVVLAPDPNAQTTCAGGTLTAAAGGGDISYSGGSLGAGAACTIAVDVTSVAVGIHPNGTESVTSSLGTSAAAEATLTVDAADAPGFARVFSPDTIPQGGETQIVFTVDNTANLIDLGELAFTDAFPDGLVVAGTPNASTTCGGTFSPVAGATTLAFADGALAAGATCELRVAVRAIEAGMLTGPEVVLTSSIAMATAAEATLTVDPAVAPVFSKTFSPATVAPGGVSTLTFRIDNTANLIDVGGLAFDDAFPDGLAVADPPNGSTTCGGTFAPAAFATSLAFSGGRVAAGQACTISVDVLASRAGALTSTSGDLTSDLPVATSGASATLTVNAAPLSVSMSFAPSAIGQGGVSRLTYDLNNGAAVAATSVALSDSLPADVVVADTPNAETTCAGGTLTAAAGGSEVSYSGGTLGAGATCMIAVDVTSVAVGRHLNDMASATSSLGASPPAEATLTVDAAAAPGFARVFSPATIAQGGETEIVFTVDNTANAIAMTGMAFDTSLPSGVSVADTPGTGNSCGGTFNPVAGATTLAFTGGVLVAGATCELRVTVRAIEAGTLTGPAVALMSSIATATAAEAMLTVGAATSPGFVKVFSPATVAPGGVSTLTYTIDNAANLIDVGGLAFDDDFPAGLAVAGTPNGSTTCGGTFAPAASATSLAFSGGRVAAGGTCTISVDVLASRAGALTGMSGDLTSDLPVTTSGASATLTVNEEPLSVSMSFSPAVIGQGRVSRLTYDLNNGAAVAATSVDLSDSLPADVVVAAAPNAQTTCAGGTLTAAAGGSEVSYSGGTLGAGATCMIAVDVTSVAVGRHPNDMASATSSLGDSTPAEATLTIDPAAAPDFARVFSPDTIGQGGETQIVFTVDNTANAIAMTGMAFGTSLPSGVSVADTPGTGNSCGGTFNPVAGATTLAFTGGVLAAGATCELRVTVRAIEAGTLTSPAVALMSSIATATAAEAMLTVGAATSPGFVKVFSPDTVDPGGVSTLTYTIDNAANLIDVGGLAFDDDFPDGLAVAGTPNGSTTCGGTFAPAASATSLAFTGGRVAAGQTCTISVDVLASRAGALTGTSSDLTSDLPVDAPGVPATLTVREAPLSVSMSFSPAGDRSGRGLQADLWPGQRGGGRGGVGFAVRQSARRCGAGRSPRCADDLHWRHADGGGGR